MLPCEESDHAHVRDWRMLSHEKPVFHESASSAFCEKWK